ncbi:MAG: sigma factor [Planctomycetota bacterium]|nr:sigma factor [Planctomycetota bacterium]
MSQSWTALLKEVERSANEVCVDHSERQDLVQEALVRVWERLASEGGLRPTNALVRTVLRRLKIDHWRRGARAGRARAARACRRGPGSVAGPRRAQPEPVREAPVRTGSVLLPRRTVRRRRAARAGGRADGSVAGHRGGVVRARGPRGLRGAAAPAPRAASRQRELELREEHRELILTLKFANLMGYDELFDW